MRRRKVAKKRRRYAITPSTYAERMARVRNYQRVLAMAPWTFAAGLDYRRWAGQTTSFRDAERSAKVEGDGDPLGLVDPFVGEPLVQEVSADRPVWTGEGAAFSGGSHLVSGLHPMEGMTAICTGRLENLSSNRGIFGAHDGADHRYYLEYLESSGTYRYGAGDTLRQTSISADTDPHVWALRLGDTADFFLDGVVVDSIPYIFAGTSGDPVSVGARGFSGDTGVVPMEGSLGSFLASHLALTDTQIAKMSDLLL